MSADNEVQLYAPVDGLPQDEEGEGNWHFQVFKINFLTYRYPLYIEIPFLGSKEIVYQFQ